MNLPTLTHYTKQVSQNQKVSSTILNQCLDTIDSSNATINAFITPTPEYARERLSASVGLQLAGAPLAIKDNILVAGVTATGASDMLRDYVAPYTATCIRKLEDAGGLMIGKANMDEYAMGSSGEYSAMGPTLNPLDHTRVPGGSSSGSAAAVASGMCLAALGTDTAGSVRLPAAFCGLVGAKPTYGRISRYGVQAMASSFDQVGVLTQTVDDAALLTQIMSGYDPLDATSVQRPVEEVAQWTETSAAMIGVRIAVPKQFFTTGLDERIETIIREQLVILQQQGAIVEEVDVPLFADVLPVYYALMPAEVSTNLARYDGIRYGAQDETHSYETLHDYYAAIRSSNFGPEVKRRILTGAYVLSSSHYEGFFQQAQKLRRMIADECSRIFDSYDAIIGPTAPELPRQFGQKSADPLTMYLADIYTVIANIVGLPAISVPVGSIAEGDGIFAAGCHIMTKHRDEQMMWRVARAVESCQL